MKKRFLLTLLTPGVLVLNAQSVEQGNKEMYYERYNTAANTFHQVLKEDPSDKEAWYGLTKDYLLLDKVQQALDTLQKAPADVKDEPFYKVAYGAALLQKGNTAEATTYFNDALKETKEKKPEILSAVAKAYMMAKPGDANYAVQLLQKAIDRDKHNPALYVQLGNAYQLLHNGTEAYKAYQKAIEEDDKYAAAYHQVGVIFLSQKNPDMYVDYFKKALAADPNYAPSIYKLYAYEFYHNPSQALNYYQDYVAKSDPSENSEYDIADLYYINKQYDQAIAKANTLLSKYGDNAQPRLFKLMAYSYAEKKDTATALANMKKYFDKANDTTIIPRDYLTMGDLYASLNGQDSLVTVFYAKGVKGEEDSTVRYTYYQKLANLAADKKDFSAQANWIGKYYIGNPKATNVDLFNWGLAHFRAGEYVQADTVYGRYVAKYPEQSYGFYWQAKSKALQDSAMEKGTAVPAYLKLIEVLQKDTTDANYKKWTAEAYSYLAAYETNTEKDYGKAVSYFEKVLTVDPENADAKKYIVLLEKNLAQKAELEANKTETETTDKDSK